MDSQATAHMLFGLAFLLLTAWVFGEIGRRLRQPPIVGELLAGIVLGPSIFGNLFPEQARILSFGSSTASHFFSGFTTLAAMTIMLLAGLEMDFERLKQRKFAATLVSAGGLVVPFALGLWVAWLFPHALGIELDSTAWVKILCFATAMSISALPVIARVLSDLKLLKTDVGAITLAAAAVNDFAGWLIFSVVLSAAPFFVSQSVVRWDSIIGPLAIMVGNTFLFLGLMFFPGRLLLDKLFGFIAHAPGKMLALSLIVLLFSAAITETIGIHALMGAFITGIVLGKVDHFSKSDQRGLKDLVFSFFAPIFFASVGLRVNFVQNVNISIVLIVLVVASIGKILGCGVAARLGGMTQREAWSIGVAMNARGAMGIVLGMVALQNGLIGEPMFVALVIMALVTSVAVAPIISRLKPN